MVTDVVLVEKDLDYPLDFFLYVVNELIRLATVLSSASRSLFQHAF
jgi:hypothetical protein